GVDAQPRYAARRWRRARRGDRRRLIGRGGAPRTVAGPRQSGVARPQRACPHLDPPPAQLSKLRCANSAEQPQARIASLGRRSHIQAENREERGLMSAPVKLEIFSDYV